MYHIFEAREYFEYGIPTFDKIVQSTGVDSSFILYQETIMAVLAFAGFPQDETYDIIKAISKKRIKKIMQIRPRFIENFKKEIITNDGLSEQEAIEASEKIWTIIENSSQYGFNASHSYSMAYDSLLCAYYKSHHTLIFYETLLQEYTLKGNKDKVSALKSEALKFFNIESEPFRFRQDNRSFVANFEKNTIQQDLNSIKGFGKKIGKYLYSVRSNEYVTFIELLKDMPSSEITAPQLDTLIKLDYFQEFGLSKVLCKIVEMYNKYYYCKVLSKKNLNPKLEEIIKKYARATESQYRDIDNQGLISELISLIPNKDFSLVEKIKFQFEFLGYSDYKNENIDPDYHLVVGIERKYKNPTIDLYNISTGDTKKIKCKAKDFDKNEFAVWDMLSVVSQKEEGRWKQIDGEWVQDRNNKEPILKEWRIIKC
jgi:DNA polymerase III alpha subunit